MNTEEPLPRRRASSSPAASLEHFERGCRRVPVHAVLAQATRGVHNPRVPASLLGSLVRSLAKVELVRTCALVGPAEAQTSASDEAAVSSQAPAPAVQTASEAATPASRADEAIRAELDAAKTQIQLLNKVNEQMLRQYNALEAENHRLQDAYDQITSENDSLKAKLAQRQEEIDEQFHMICKLQRDMPDKS